MDPLMAFPADVILPDSTEVNREWISKPKKMGKEEESQWRAPEVEETRPLSHASLYDYVG